METVWVAPVSVLPDQLHVYAPATLAISAVRATPTKTDSSALSGSPPTVSVIAGAGTAVLVCAEQVPTWYLQLCVARRMQPTSAFVTV